MVDAFTQVDFLNSSRKDSLNTPISIQKGIQTNFYEYKQEDCLDNSPDMPFNNDYSSTLSSPIHTSVQPQNNAIVHVPQSKRKTDEQMRLLI